jgi:hypothetical protein
LMPVLFAAVAWPHATASGPEVTPHGASCRSTALRAKANALPARSDPDSNSLRRVMPRRMGAAMPRLALSDMDSPRQPRSDLRDRAYSAKHGIRLWYLLIAESLSVKARSHDFRQHVA